MSNRNTRKSLSSLFATRSFASSRGQHRPTSRGARLRFEPLEDRCLLAGHTWWVDPGHGNGTTIFDSIQAAISASATHNGDTIKVVAGNYDGDINVTKSLTMIGGQVRISGEPVGPSNINNLTNGFSFDANGITIKDFTLSDLDIGAFTNGFSGFNITNNRFAGCDTSIALSTSVASSTKTSTISGNVFAPFNDSTQQTTGISGGPVRNVTISNNTFENEDSHASIDIFNSTIQSNNLQIVNNSFGFEEAQDAGIIVANVTKAKIDGNTFEDPTTTAISLSGGVTNSEIANNMFQVDFDGEPNHDGIDLSQAMLASPDTGNKISGNTINGFKNGISLSAANLNTVSNNTVTGSVLDGIVVQANSASNTVSSNSISACMNYGIELSSADSNGISNNKTSECGMDGIILRVASNGNTVSGNTANFNGQEGIELNSSNGNKLSGDTAIFNQGGFELTSSSNNMLSNNNAQRCFGGFGLDTSSTGNTLTGNTSQLCIDGFDVESGSTNNTLNKDTAKNNVNYGFDIEADDNTVTGCTAANNQADGIYLASAHNNTISSNTVKSNVGNGIEVSTTSTGNTISGNTAMDNGDAMGGFDLLDDSNTTTNNTWKNNHATTRNPFGLN